MCVTREHKLPLLNKSLKGFITETTLVSLEDRSSSSKVQTIEFLSVGFPGDELHMVKGDRVRLVLRSRQQVEVALKDYHNELNHLDTNKCLRLLNERWGRSLSFQRDVHPTEHVFNRLTLGLFVSDRFFWKTMRPDVVQWISSCSECNRQTRKKPENQAAGGGGSESSLQTHTSPQIHRDVSRYVTV